MDYKKKYLKYKIKYLNLQTAGQINNEQINNMIRLEEAKFKDELIQNLGAQLTKEEINNMITLKEANFFNDELIIYFSAQLSKKEINNMITLKKAIFKDELIIYLGSHLSDENINNMIRLKEANFRFEYIIYYGAQLTKKQINNMITLKTNQNDELYCLIISCNEVFKDFAKYTDIFKKFKILNKNNNNIEEIINYDGNNFTDEQKNKMRELNEIGFGAMVCYNVVANLTERHIYKMKILKNQKNFQNKNDIYIDNLNDLIIYYGCQLYGLDDLDDIYGREIKGPKNSLSEDEKKNIKNPLYLRYKINFDQFIRDSLEEKNDNLYCLLNNIAPFISFKEITILEKIYYEHYLIYLIDKIYNYNNNNKDKMKYIYNNNNTKEYIQLFLNKNIFNKTYDDKIKLFKNIMMSLYIN